MQIDMSFLPEGAIPSYIKLFFTFFRVNSSNMLQTKLSLTMDDYIKSRSKGDGGRTINYSRIKISNQTVTNTSADNKTGDYRQTCSLPFYKHVFSKVSALELVKNVHSELNF